VSLTDSETDIIEALCDGALARSELIRKVTGRSDDVSECIDEMYSKGLVAGAKGLIRSCLCWDADANGWVMR